jgi:hypothetical protein
MHLKCKCIMHQRCARMHAYNKPSLQACPPPAHVWIQQELPAAIASAYNAPAVPRASSKRKQQDSQGR